MGFEIFTRKVVRISSPTITFTALGRISLNSASTRILEKDATEFVLLLWDKEQKTMAIRPTRKKDTRTYRVCYSKRGNSAGFSAKTFADYIGLDLTETRTTTASWNDAESQLEAKIPDEYLVNEEMQKPVIVERVKRIRRTK